MLKKFWVRSDDNVPVTLIGYRVTGDVAEFTTATCSPYDKFNRRFAHNQVEGLMRGGAFQSVKVKDTDDSAGVLRSILEHIVDQDMKKYGRDPIDSRFRLATCFCALSRHYQPKLDRAIESRYRALP